MVMALEKGFRGLGRGQSDRSQAELPLCWQEHDAHPNDIRRQRPNAGPTPPEYYRELRSTGYTGAAPVRGQSSHLEAVPKPQAGRVPCFELICLPVAGLRV